MTVYRQFTFDSAHRLLNYNGKCNNLHGHTWKVKVGFKGEINPGTNMIVDFTEIKKRIKPIQDALDHCVILETGDPLIQILKSQDILVLKKRPTAEYLAQFILEKLNCDSIILYETPDSYVEYHK